MCRFKYSDIAGRARRTLRAQADVRSRLFNILLHRSTLEIVNGKTVISRSRHRKLQNDDLLFGEERYRISER